MWSCSWSDNNNIIYAGLANGNIDEIDCRKLTAPISTITSQSGGPILSMQYVRSNDHFKSRGLLVTNSQGVSVPGYCRARLTVPLQVVFLRRSSESCQPPVEGLTSYRLDTLLMASTYGSTLVDTAFNETTSHLLNTFRPNASARNVRYLFSAIGERASESDAMYASSVQSLYGASSLDCMSRSCFVTGASNGRAGKGATETVCSGIDSHSVNLAIAANEEKAAIRLWDLNTNFDYVDWFPKEVTRQKPVIDLCQYSCEPVSFAALNCENLYMYKQFE